MDEHIQSQLKTLLKQEEIKLWSPPYTNDNDEVGREQMQDLATRYSKAINFPFEVVEEALENIRSQACIRGQGNKTFKETKVATLELLLPRDIRKGPKQKERLATMLNVMAQDLMNMIAEKYDLKYLKLILNGKKLCPDKQLDEQGVKNNSKIMVLKASEPEWKKLMAKEEEKMRLQDETLQRTQKGFQILSERDGSEDPVTTPFLEIADQKGMPIQIPASERKALIVAMGFHEKGRALMKRKNYDAALDHLVKSDEHFSKCGSALLNTVDNYAVLQLDIVWCYRALEALTCLDDAKQRLKRAEDCFLRCYGKHQERLQQIKGTSGGEQVLFLRLYLLQSLLAYLDGHANQARQKLMEVEDLYSRLCLNPESMNQMMILGFTEQEARLGLRACSGDMNAAAILISKRRDEREEIKSKERAKRRVRLEAINTLVELGFNKSAASKALHTANGNVDEAYRILLESNEASSSGAYQPDPDRENKMQQLVYLGFDWEAVDAALKLAGNDLEKALKILQENQGMVPPELLSPSPPSSSSDEPSTSGSTGAGPSDLEADLVNEVLDDIPRHEEDYLDVTLEEESDVIAQIKSYLYGPEKSPDETCGSQWHK